jgi:hypothetical protein
MGTRNSIRLKYLPFILRVLPALMSQKAQKGETAQFHWPADSETNSNLVGGYGEVGFGARPWGQVSKDFDVLFDDIVIDTKRIGPAR